MITYPASTGRNFDEILRVIDSLQLTANYSVATPVNWKDGDDCIIVPAVTNEQAKEKFPAGFTEIKPYLRITPQPNKVKGRAIRREWLSNLSLKSSDRRNEVSDPAPLYQ